MLTFFKATYTYYIQLLLYLHNYMYMYVFLKYILKYTNIVPTVRYKCRLETFLC